MSWIRRELANERYWSEPDWQGDVESSEMREEIGLRYYLDPGDEHLAPEELGRRIDDCLVEYINTSLQRLKGRVISRAGEEDIIIKGDITIEEFRPRMRKIEEGMGEDLALKAFEGTEKRGEKLPLASRTYLEMARRHVLYGGNPLPSSENGRRFALVLLDEVMDDEKWETDWDGRTFADVLARCWLDSRDPEGYQVLIRLSEESPVIWDALELICQEVADRGEARPNELLKWSFDASHGRLACPDEEPAPRHRPAKLGYKFRNNEIRHTVNLLVLVGMPKIAGRSAVAKAFGFALSRIGQICREPYFTYSDLMEDVVKRIFPSYYEFLHGLGPTPALPPPPGPLEPFISIRGKPKDVAGFASTASTRSTPRHG